MRRVRSCCAEALRKRMVGTAAAAVPAAMPFNTRRRPSFLCFRSSMRPPCGVVLPATTEEVIDVVKIAHAHQLPVVPRGSGTGLSGGALPVPEGVLVGLSRMKRIIEIDLENCWMRVEPGVINLE